MSKCPYTWVKNLFGSNKPRDPSAPAENLRVIVEKGGQVTVDVSLPSRSARWLIEMIPSDVLKKIREEGIPIDDMQTELAARDILRPQDIFVLTEPNRSVRVWLE
jgi:hypothetical protein